MSATVVSGNNWRENLQKALVEKTKLEEEMRVAEEALLLKQQQEAHASKLKSRIVTYKESPFLSDMMDKSKD